jgi:acetoin utilization protein AcuC
MQQEAEVAFNPSGGYHHAGPESASGFCYVNDVALACLVLADRFDRVLFLDIDVHHGDGVQDFFYDRADVMTMSLHESGETLFPGTGFEDDIGTGEGRGYSVNIPLPVGTYDAAYMRVFEATAMPLIRAYDPDVIVFEAGADGLAGDPLAFLHLTNKVHEQIASRVAAFGKPVLATGGGGYHPENTARAWAVVWCALTGEESQAEMALGLGGVMLESTDWQAGLRDRELPPISMQRRIVDPAIDETIKRVRANLFAIHGL